MVYFRPRARVCLADKGRDRIFLIVLCTHTPLALILGLLVAHAEIPHIMVEALAPAALAAFAYRAWAGTRSFRLIGAVLLMVYAGVLVHFSGGLIEVVCVFVAEYIRRSAVSLQAGGSLYADG